ncbi:hypothetical protein [Actinosynnema sp. NPDC020468]|uniref:sunset domain-containing protein n=1 Tax=Actinosynnema sp. NPDC020468 TaxID=3154488 RepID=UPI0033E3BFCF
MVIFGQVWLWSLLSFVAGVALTWLVLVRPAKRQSAEVEERQRLSAPVAPAPPGVPSAGPTVHDDFDEWHMASSPSATTIAPPAPSSGPPREPVEPVRVDLANVEYDRRDEHADELDDEHRPLSDFEERSAAEQRPQSLFERLGSDPAEPRFPRQAPPEQRPPDQRPGVDLRGVTAEATVVVEPVKPVEPPPVESPVGHSADDERDTWADYEAHLDQEAAGDRLAAEHAAFRAAADAAPEGDEEDFAADDREVQRVDAERTQYQPPVVAPATADDEWGAFSDRLEAEEPAAEEASWTAFAGVEGGQAAGTADRRAARADAVETPVESAEAEVAQDAPWTAFAGDQEPAGQPDEEPAARPFAGRQEQPVASDPAHEPETGSWNTYAGESASTAQEPEVGTWNTYAGAPEQPDRGTGRKASHEQETGAWKADAGRQEQPVASEQAVGAPEAGQWSAFGGADAPAEVAGGFGTPEPFSDGGPGAGQWNAFGGGEQADASEQGGGWSAFGGPAEKSGQAERRPLGAREASSRDAGGLTPLDEPIQVFPATPPPVEKGARGGLRPLDEPIQVFPADPASAQGGLTPLAEPIRVFPETPEEVPTLPVEETRTLPAVTEAPAPAEPVAEPTAPPEVPGFRPREVWRGEDEVYTDDALAADEVGEEEDEPEVRAEQTTLIPATALAEAIAEVDAERERIAGEPVEDAAEVVEVPEAPEADEASEPVAEEDFDDETPAERASRIGSGFAAGRPDEVWPDHDLTGEYPVVRDEKPAEKAAEAPPRKDVPARPRSLFEPLLNPEDGAELETPRPANARPVIDQPFVPQYAPELLAAEARNEPPPKPGEEPPPALPTTAAGLPTRPSRNTELPPRTPPPVMPKPAPASQPRRPRPVGFSPSTGGRPAAGTTRYRHEGFNPRSPFGPGSVLPKSDGMSPAPDFHVKATLTGRRYYTDDAAGFGDTRADVWFRTTSDAEKAGFRPA